MECSEKHKKNGLPHIEIWGDSAGDTVVILILVIQNDQA